MRERACRGLMLFDKNVRQYEAWFDDHPFAYLSALHAGQELLPMHGSGIETGIGTGRFALPLVIKQGIEASRSMAEILVSVLVVIKADK